MSIYSHHERHLTISRLQAAKVGQKGEKAARGVPLKAKQQALGEKQKKKREEECAKRRVVRKAQKQGEKRKDEEWSREWQAEKECQAE